MVEVRWLRTGELPTEDVQCALVDLDKSKSMPGSVDRMPVAHAGGRAPKMIFYVAPPYGDKQLDAAVQEAERWALQHRIGIVFVSGQVAPEN